MSDFSKFGKLPVLALAVLFFLVQTVGAAHAAQYGSDKHQHHGIECVLSVYTDDGDDVVAAPVQTLIDMPLVHWLEPVTLGDALSHRYAGLFSIRAPPVL